MRSPLIRRSPRTMVFAGSIVTSIPFFMRIDDISQRNFFHAKAQRKRKERKGNQIPVCAFASSLRLCVKNYLLNLVSRLLRGGFHSLRFFTNGQTQFHLYVSLDLSQDLRIISQRGFSIFPALAQPFTLI